MTEELADVPDFVDRIAVKLGFFGDKAGGLLCYSLQGFGSTPCARLPDYLLLAEDTECRTTGK